jgi:cobalt-zinc-cadmium efflux system outer membrane protein
MKHFPLFVLMLACSTATHAADRVATNRLDALTLEQAVDLAERQHPDLAEARALIEAAEGRVQQAGRLPNPEGIARIESAPFKGRTLDEAEYLAGIAQPVPLGSRLSKARQVEQLERDRRAKELEVRRRELRKRVHSAFATALYQDKALLTQKEIVASTDKVVTTTKARLDAGDALREDLARAEMEQARAKVELRRAAAMHEQAMVALTAAIGDPALSVQSLNGTLDTTFELPTMESLVTSLASNPTAAAADADLRASSARVDLAKAQRIPDVKVEMLYRRLQAEKENAFDVGLSIPLPLFDRNQGRIREARAEAAAAEARSRSTQNDLTFKLRDAHAQLIAALANSRALKDEVLPRADTVLKSAEARYTAGDSSLSDVLPVRRDWAAVQLTYLESLWDVMQAWAALTPFVKEK